MKISLVGNGDKEKPKAGDDFKKIPNFFFFFFESINSQISCDIIQLIGQKTPLLSRESLFKI